MKLHPSPTILIFLKAPRHGYVKTRLAAAIGDAEATRLYRQLTERQLRAVPPEWAMEIHYTPRGARAEMRAWLGPRPRYRMQVAGDLGRKLSAAFAGAFRQGAQRVLAIGADCPDLDEACLRDAVAGLDSAEVALGPARDGGYYLIGLRRNAPRLFADIPWSTSAVLSTTLRRARELRLPVRLLAEKEDIDDCDSLQRYERRLARISRMRDVVTAR